MVDYELAVATVQDPNADPVLLAKIAYENPDFGANVAANPRAYAGLKRWIAEFGDERARQYLASLGIVARLVRSSISRLRPLQQPQLRLLRPSRPQRRRPRR